MDPPLFGLLAMDFEFCWSSLCQHAFDIMKEKLTSSPILRGPNWDLPFHIHTDALDKVVGPAWDIRMISFPMSFISSTKICLRLN